MSIRALIDVPNMGVRSILDVPPGVGILSPTRQEGSAVG